MLMMGNRKKYVSQILGNDQGEVSQETPLHTIANELIEAIHSHDIETVIMCFKSMLTHCESQEGSNEHIE